MFLQLLNCGETLATLQTADLIAFGFLVAPAAGVLFVLLEVRLATKHSQTGHTVNALGFTLVLAVQLGQAEVAAASYTGVWQQTQMGEAVFEERVLLGEAPGTVCATVPVMANLFLVTREGFLAGENAATRLTYKAAQSALVPLHMPLTLFQVGEYTLAQVTLIKLFFKVSRRQVALQAFL